MIGWRIEVLMYRRTKASATQGAVLGVTRWPVTRCAVSSLMVICGGAASQVQPPRACGAVPGLPCVGRSGAGLISDHDALAERLWGCWCI